jgi:hypothetical protein
MWAVLLHPMWHRDLMGAVYGICLLGILVLAYDLWIRQDTARTVVVRTSREPRP